jgi:hypothetical protein
VSADTQAADSVSSQGHYAGSVSRFTAYVIDLAVSAGLFALGLAGTSLVAQVVTGHQVSWSGPTSRYHPPRVTHRGPAPATVD